MAQARMVKKATASSRAYPKVDEADADFSAEDVGVLTSKKQSQAAPSPAVPRGNPSSGGLQAAAVASVYPDFQAGPTKDILLAAITTPLTAAIDRINRDEEGSADALKHSADMKIAIIKIKTALEAEFEKLWAQQQKLNGKVDPSSTVQGLEAYTALVTQAGAVRALTFGVIVSVEDDNKDVTREDQHRAIKDYERTINVAVYIKESLKRLFMMLLGAAIGFLSVGSLTMDPKAAIAANAVGAGPIAGAVAGAAVGNYLYKHGRFFGNKNPNAPKPSFSIVGKEFRLANAASAYVDAVNPADGIVAKAGRGMRKVF